VRKSDVEVKADEAEVVVWREIRFCLLRGDPKVVI
jgi:hypothetical protein